MRNTQYIPTHERNRMMTGPTTGLAIIGVSASVIACVGLSMSAALHIFGGFLSAPILAESHGGGRGAPAATSLVWLAFWNILVPITLVAVTTVTFRSWRNRERAADQ
jgi:uncharacterized membrane protein YhaH (DUF805 family)